MSRSGLLLSPPPDVGLSIEASHIAAARLAWRGATPTVASHTSEPLAAGVVTPALAASNIADMPAVSRAIQQAVSRLGTRTRRVALVLPDTVAKVSLVRFDKVPSRQSDLQELVRWQIRKSAPFPLEQAIVSFTPGMRPAEGGQEFVVAVARRDVIEQYEQACTQAGVHAGLIDLATFSVINGVLASRTAPSGDWLLVHVAAAYTTLAVVRNDAVIFFRNRTEEDAESTLVDLMHQTAMYYEDRLQGGGFTRVLIAGATGAPGGTDALLRILEERLGVAVEALDPRASAALLDRITASPELLATLGPLVGILLRERRAA